MKGKTSLFVAVAATVLLPALVPLTASAQPAGSIAASKTPRAAWPRWYYYDQIGLREWHKGDKQRALNYFDQSFHMAENQVVGARTALDNRTKQMLSDVINHQQFHMTVWRSIPSSVSSTASRVELITKGATMSAQEQERQLKWLERVETFARKALGPKHLEVQALERHRRALEPQHEEDAIVNTQGKGNMGTVIRPKWYTNNERDFTPEMFTRNPRKLHEEGTEDQKRMDVTKLPEEKIQKGFTYVAGQKIDMSKPVKDAKAGWGGGTTVGVQDVNNKNGGATGWGASGPANMADQRSTDVTKWGLGSTDISAGGKRGKRTPWGSNNGEDDNVFNKPWGAGNQNQGQEGVNPQDGTGPR